MKDPTKRTKLVLPLMCLILLAAPAPVVGAPAPPQMAINDETKKCAEFFAGDECSRCTLTDGWRSIGYIYSDGAVCPPGYSMIDTSPVDASVVVCQGLSNERCCSQGFSGAVDCDDMVINNDKKQCAFVDGGIKSCGHGAYPPTQLPPGWTMQPENPGSGWLCPQDYTWTDNIQCVDLCAASLTCLECLQEDCCWFEYSPTNKCISGLLVGGWGVCPSEVGDNTDQQVCDDFETLQMDNEACKEVANCEECLATSFPSDESKKCRWFIFDEKDAGNCWAFCKGSLNCAQAERYSCSEGICPNCGVCEVCNELTADCEADETKNGNPCDDGIDCTTDDKCWDGKCSGTSKCKFCEKCNLSTGKCDNDDGKECEDADKCTLQDVCFSGNCQGGPRKNCEECQVCDPVTGNCIPIEGCSRTEPPAACEPITIDFDKAADGTPIKRGDYVTDQWKSLGMTVTASGTKSSKQGARVFDTANPGTQEAGDPDLGAPNQRCTPPGPGVGEGGEPNAGNEGVNCEALGKALIVQEDNDNPNIPDDNVKGGTITFDFFEAGGKYVYEMGLLDIDYATTVKVVYDNGNGGTSEKDIVVPLLGDNSFQVLSINQATVMSIKVMMTRSGAVTYIKFCSCRKVTVDFDQAADGTPIIRGDYVTDQWKSLGMTIAASGTVSSKTGARIFDTANPGTQEAGDPDLGAPNQRCTPPGPGVGRGGEPYSGNKGVNCKPLGNVLIVQEDNDIPSIPDDNVNGGIITFDFFEAGGKYVYEMGLLDIDYATTVKVVHENGIGGTSEKDIVVPLLGDNSFQVLNINQATVRSIKIMMTRSGAVTFVSFCA